MRIHPLFAVALGGLLLTARCRAQTPTESPNYTHAPAMVGLKHWARFPIYVYFTPGPAATEPTLKATQAGFTEWVQASGGVIGYKVVTDPAQADLSVTFHPDTFLPKQRGVMGLTTIICAGDVVKKASVQLATGDATPEELQTSAAHEFGHALGINGHSDNSDDLMYPSETRIVALDGVPIVLPAHPVTARDLNTLKLGYGVLWTQFAAHLPPGVPKE